MDERRPVSTTRTYNRIIEHVAQLNILKFDLPASLRSGDAHRPAYTLLRHHLRHLHEELLTSDPSFMVTGELLNELWQSLYYSIVEQARNAVGHNGNEQREGLIRRELLALLDEGVGFFILLIYRLKGRLLEDGDGDENEFESAAFRPKGPETIKKAPISRDILISLLYDCLVFLGDLSRYKCAFSNLESSTLLNVAAREYLQATTLIPTNGHAYNQLAVLSCMEDNVLDGLAYYMRAATSVKAFDRASENLLTVGRRVAGTPEERLALAADASTAALFGLLLRLIASTIVGELSSRGGSQTETLTTICSALTRRLIPGDNIMITSDPNDEGTLMTIFATIILTVEFLAQPGDTHIGRGGQLRLIEWLFNVADRILRQTFLEEDPSRTPGLKALSLVSLWLGRTDVMARISNTNISQCAGFDVALGNILRTYSEAMSKLELTGDFAMDKVDVSLLLPEDRALLGTRPFAHLDPLQITSDATIRIARIRQVVLHLSQTTAFLIYDQELQTFHFREDYERIIKRDTLGIRLARQRLLDQVGNLEASINTEAETTSPWHLLDAESLINHWQQLEQLIPQMRLLVTLSTLRFLDFAKNDNDRAPIARRIMRCISRNIRGTTLHLQNPRESVDVMIRESTNTGKHHRAFISAQAYFATKSEFQPMVILTEDPILGDILDQLRIEYIADINLYLTTTVFK